MRPDEFVMPRAGQVWRHYKSRLYTVIGVGQDDNGIPVVVYTESGWADRGQTVLPPLYIQPLGRFLSTVDPDKVPRFHLERHADPGCPYLPRWEGLP